MTALPAMPGAPLSGRPTSDASCGSLFVFAVASASLARLFAGPPRPARVLGASSRGAWLAIAGARIDDPDQDTGGAGPHDSDDSDDSDDVVVITARGGARLPNSVELAAETVPAVLSSAHPACVAAGSLVVAGHRLIITRYWDPRPALGTLQPADRVSFASRIARARAITPALLHDDVPCAGERALTAALAGRRPAEILAVAASLLGRGPGLTPACDDFLAGAMGAFQLYADALGDDDALALLGPSGPGARLLDLARTRTTALSRSLLGHALAGRVAWAAGTFARALTGRGDVERAVAALLAVGASSGLAMAHGVLCGATAVITGERPPAPVATSRLSGGTICPL